MCVADPHGAAPVACGCIWGWHEWGRNRQVWLSPAFRNQGRPHRSRHTTRRGRPWCASVPSRMREDAHNSWTHQHAPLRSENCPEIATTAQGGARVQATDACPRIADLCTAIDRPADRDTNDDTQDLLR